MGTNDLSIDSNMKITLALVFALVAVAAADHDFSPEDIGISQDIADDGAVTGQYSFTDPEGNTHFVRYVADEDGFRVLESNAIPASLDGVRADGNQGSFTSLESSEEN